MKALILAIVLTMAVTACAPVKPGTLPTIFDRISGGE